MKKLSPFFLFIAIAFFTGTNYAQSNIGLLGGIDFPMGSFSDGSSTGFGFAGNYEYMIMPQLGLTGSVGYFHFGGASINGGFGATFDGPSFSIIPIVFGSRYYFIKGPVMPYGGLELGLYITSASENTNNLNGLNGLFKSNTPDRISQFINNTTSNSSSSVNFGFAPYVGVRFLVSPHVGIEGNVKFNIITGGGTSTNQNDLTNLFGGTANTTSSSILYFGINAGVFFLL